jgi:hypothetical protein
LPTPTYQIAANLLPGLTFNLEGTDEMVAADFTGGALEVDLTVNAGGSGAQLKVIGTGAGQSFTMTDYQIGLTAGGGVIYYSNLDTMNLLTCEVHYSGGFATLNRLIVNSGCVFYWGG